MTPEDSASAHLRHYRARTVPRSRTRSPDFRESINLPNPGSVTFIHSHGPLPLLPIAAHHPISHLSSFPFFSQTPPQPPKMTEKFTGKQFSFSALKQRALGGGGRQKRRPASMMDISVVREGEVGGVPSGVKMNLVPLEQTAPAPPPQHFPFAKKVRSTVNYSVSSSHHF